MLLLLSRFGTVRVWFCGHTDRKNGARTFLSAYGNKACGCFADLRMFRLEFWGRGPTDVCAEAGGVGAWLRRTADKKNGATWFPPRFRDRYSYGFAVIRIERTERGHSCPRMEIKPTDRLGKRGRNHPIGIEILVGSDRVECHAEPRSYASDSDPDFDNRQPTTDNRQPTIRNEKPETRNKKSSALRMLRRPADVSAGILGERTNGRVRRSRRRRSMATPNSG